MTTETEVQNLDAFDGVDAPREESPDTYEALQMAATLQDAKVSAASNGDNYDVTFEIDVEGFVRLAIAMAQRKGSYSATWNRVSVGNGAEIKRLAVTKDVDGDPHYKLHLHLPQSEISRSLGRLGTQLRKRAALELEPEQGSLGLSDGRVVDLTARAADAAVEPADPADDDEDNVDP
jgi:hypothetical protein